MQPDHNSPDMLDELQKIARNAEAKYSFCRSEEDTKSYLIEPMLRVLGYDVTNHLDARKEYEAGDAGKVDYALLRDDRPVILVEAKALGDKLGDEWVNQLGDYFASVRSASYGVLTNGRQYRWYKGKGKGIVMDHEPFLVHDAGEPSDAEVPWLRGISKRNFDPPKLRTLARRFDLENRILEWISTMFLATDLSNAAALNAALKLKVPKKDHGIISEVAISAMDRFIDLRNMRPLEFEWRSHTGNSLVLEDGSELVASKGRRAAWRIAGGNWEEENSATAATTAVLTAMLECDDRRGDPDALAQDFRLKRSESVDLGKYRLIPGYCDLYYNKANETPVKVQLLEYVAGNLRFDPPPESPLSRVPRIEWWLPCNLRR